MIPGRCADKEGQNERADTKFSGIGVGWTLAFINNCYHSALRYLIAYFVKDIRKLSNGLGLALYVTFGNESFVKAPEVLFTLELTKIQLDSLVTLIVMTYGKMEHLFVITGAVAGVEKGV